MVWVEWNHCFGWATALQLPPSSSPSPYSASRILGWCQGWPVLFVCSTCLPRSRSSTNPVRQLFQYSFLWIQENFWVFVLKSLFSDLFLSVSSILIYGTTIFSGTFAVFSHDFSQLEELECSLPESSHGQGQVIAGTEVSFMWTFTHVSRGLPEIHLDRVFHPVWSPGLLYSVLCMTVTLSPPVSTHLVF